MTSDKIKSLTKHVEQLKSTLTNIPVRRQKTEAHKRAYVDWLNLEIRRSSEKIERLKLGK